MLDTLCMKPLYTCVKISLLFLLLLVSSSGYGAITISSSFRDSTKCPNDSFNVPYTVSAAYPAGNAFNVLLSDTAGNFLSPIIIGSLVSTTSGSIRCAIPPGILSGYHYRLKIISTATSDTSANNGRDIIITNIGPIFTSNNGPLCAGDSLVVQALVFTPGVNYHWTGPNGFASNVQTPYVLNAQQTLSGSFTVSASLNNCSVSASMNVTVKQKPAPIAASNSPVCVGDTLKLQELSTVAGQTYLWLGPGGIAFSTKNHPIANVQITYTGTYTVSVTLNGCTTVDSVDVLVNPMPAKPVASGTTSLCAGDTLRLNATSTTSGVSFEWTGGGMFFTVPDPNIANAQPSQSGLYIVKASLGNCSLTDSQVVVINANPIITASHIDSVCQGDTLILQAFSKNGGVYRWTSISGFSDTGKTRVVRPFATASFAGLYFVQLTDSNGCKSNIDSVFTVIKPLPAGTSISGNNIICEGHALILNAFSSSAGVTYKWQGPVGLTSDNSTITIASATSGMSGDYSCTILLNGCNITLDTVVLVKPSVSPDVTISVDPGTEVAKMTPITFTAHAINAGSNPKYQWKLNGSDIAGATDSVYNCRMGMGLSDNDKIFVTVRSTDDCPLFDSVLSFAFTLRVKADDGAPYNITLFPSPNDGHFSVAGILPSSEKIEARVINIAGQLIYKTTLVPNDDVVNADIDLGHISSGVYTFQVQSGNQVFNQRFTVK